MIRAWLWKIAYPIYECEDCIGMKHYGCYCSHHNGAAPGMPESRRQKIAKWLLEWL